MLYSRARGAWALTMAAWGRPPRLLEDSLNQALFRCRERTYRNVKPMRSVSTPYSSRSNGTSPGAQLQSAARLATLPARLYRRRLGPAARGDKHRGSGKRCRSGVQRTHLTAVPTELHACLMRAPASASPSIGPHSRPQHGREQRDQGHRLAATAQELPLIWCVHGLLIARGLAMLQTCGPGAGGAIVFSTFCLFAVQYTGNKLNQK